MGKVLLHNLSLPYVGQPDNLYTFDRNALFYAEEGDTVVMRSPTVDASWLSYLQSIGAVPESMQIIYAQPGSGPFSIFQDEAVIQQLHQSSAGQTLDSFMCTARERSWADQIGLKIVDSPYESFAGKDYFRRLAEQNQVPIPPGTIVETPEAAYAAANELFKAGYTEIVIKEVQGVAGLSSVRLTAEAFGEITAPTDMVLPMVAVETANPAYIVEAWLDTTASPSAQMYISATGEIAVVSLHFQLMRPNGMSYAGCVSADFIAPQIATQLVTHAKAIGDTLVADGYVGHISVNFIVDQTETIWSVEINPRRVISSYAHNIASRLATTAGTPPVYWLQEVTRPEWVGVSMTTILASLEHELYSPKTRAGVIPIDGKLLASHGSLMCLAIADTIEAVQTQLQKF